jgi:hypothetical protein
MTASQTLTPSQAGFIQAARERRARIAAKAKPDTPILCLSASARSQRADVPPVVLLKPSPPPVVIWAQRQIQQYQPWFEVVEEIDAPPKPKHPPIHLIQRTTANFYGVTVEDIIGERRMKFMVIPRQVAVYLSKTLTVRSLPEIGRRFGGRDHATILHSFKKIARLIESEDELRGQVESIKNEIGAAHA